MSLSTCRCGEPGTLGASCVRQTCRDDGLHCIPIADANAYRLAKLDIREPLVGAYIGKFLIVRRLGRGGFGRVLLGLQRPLFKSPAAVKVLAFEDGSEAMREVIAQKFVLEAEALAGLRHPNIVRFIDFDHGDPPYLAMEFLPGGRTLTTAMDGRPFPAPVTRHLAAQLLRALKVIHDAGLIHRDLKPDNIMLDEVDGDRWVVKLVDFGLAKDVVERSDTDYVAGTAAYLAPEQIHKRALGPATDLYALAVIMFELMAGRRLFASAQAVTIALKSDDRHDPLAEHPDLAWPAGVRAFFRRALEPRPEARFGSVGAFADAFGRLDLDAIDLPHDLTITRPPDLTITRPPEPPPPLPQTTSHTVGKSDRDPRRAVAWTFAAAVVVAASFALPAVVERSSPEVAVSQDEQVHAIPAESSRARARELASIPPTSESDASTDAVVVEVDVSEVAPTPEVTAPSSKALAPLVALTVTSRPTRARVSAGGRVLGVTPLAIQVTPDTTLVLEAKGYLPRRHVVTAASAKRMPIVLAIEP